MGEKISLLPLLCPPQKCRLKTQTHPAHRRGNCVNPSRNRSRTLKRSWSELLAQNEPIRAMTAAANTVKSVVSPFYMYSETILAPRLLDVGGLPSARVPLWKPTALSPVERARSGVRILDDSLVYNRPVLTPTHPLIRLSLFLPSHISLEHPL